MAPGIRVVAGLAVALLQAASARAEPDGGHCAAWAPSGRGGYLLPAGYLGTSGSAIVDSYNNPVRIASIGWDGSAGPAGAAPQGLWATSYRTILESIRDAGFNTVRIPWSDVNLDARPANTVKLGNVDFDRNRDFRGLTISQIFHKIVDYASQIGLKVIFDHHSNEGCCGQQKNGLWFDQGPGTDGTDGAGNKGLVSTEKFQRNWVRFATEYAGNATVIGFDLTNEPTSYGHVNWGLGGATDIRAMYQSTGDAIQAVNPGVLIIAEGPQNYDPPPERSGMDPGSPAPEGNLTGVAAAPIRLTIQGKLVYSVHEYPNEIAQFPGADAGEAFVERMNRAWGWLIKRDIAPVWIGEMGSSMRMPESKEWARTLLDYMNDAGRQPVSGSWWHIGPAPDEPDGIQTAWGPDHYRPEQLAVTDRLLFKPQTSRRCEGRAASK